MCSLPLLFHRHRISRKILVVCEKICYHRGMKDAVSFPITSTCFVPSGHAERRALMKRSSYGERDYAFGQIMLTLRTAIGLTQAGLADHLGVSQRAVGEWEGDVASVGGD